MVNNQWKWVNFVKDKNLRKEPAVCQSKTRATTATSMLAKQLTSILCPPKPDNASMYYIRTNARDFGTYRMCAKTSLKRPSLHILQQTPQQWRPLVVILLSENTSGVVFSEGRMTTRGRFCLQGLRSQWLCFKPCIHVYAWWQQRHRRVCAYAQNRPGLRCFTKFSRSGP